MHWISAGRVARDGERLAYGLAPLGVLPPVLTGLGRGIQRLARQSRSNGGRASTQAPFAIPDSATA